MVDECYDVFRRTTNGSFSARLCLFVPVLVRRIRAHVPVIRSIDYGRRKTEDVTW